MKFAPQIRRAFDKGHWRITSALLLLLAATWMPDVNLPRNTYNYMVTFDITQSMNVDDVMLDGAPVSRLALARAATREALRQLPCGSKVGWSIFADYRSFALLLPIEVCSNYDVLLSTLDKIDGRMRWANASNIGKGIYWSLRNAHAIPATDIIFFTDGQEAPPLRPGQQSIPIKSGEVGEVGGWLIGVGGDLPSRIPRTNTEGVVTGYWAADEVVQVAGLPPGQSHEHLSELREKYLASLATQTGLGYSRLETPASLTRAMLDTTRAHRAPAPTNLRWIPALLAMVLLTWNYLPEGRVVRRLVAE
ncbi:MAG: MxaL protein [Glaciimonas sp.]|nr:MxaL protein [Glaciimonas sp.]